MPQLTGRFYFKLTSNGNLLGEYSHDDQSCHKAYVEAAVRQDRMNKELPFEGEYVTTWIEPPNNKSDYSGLSIKSKQGANGLYTLVWTDSGKDRFKGEAMLCDDILVGNYRPA